MEQVFISYSRRDLAFVKRLSADLQAAGLKVWYDLSGLEAGTRWSKEIQNALRQSQYFLVVLSPNSVESEWVEREFIYASNLKLKIVPLLYRECELPLWSLNMHYLELNEEIYSDSWGNLLRILGVKPQPEKPVVEVVIEPPVITPEIIIEEAVPFIPPIETEEQGTSQPGGEMEEPAVVVLPERGVKEDKDTNAPLAVETTIITPERKDEPVVVVPAVSGTEEKQQTTIPAVEPPALPPQTEEIPPLVSKKEQVEAIPTPIVERKTEPVAVVEEKKRKKPIKVKPVPRVKEKIKKSPRPGVKKAWVVGLGGLLAIVVFILGIVFFGGDIKAALFPGKSTQTISSTKPLAATFSLTISTTTPAETLTTAMLLDSDGIRQADGMQMVYVPEGEFTMGSDEGNENEQPAHPVYLDAYWMDQTEVTNAMYAVCVSYGGCEWSSLYSKMFWDAPVIWPDRPVFYVDWNGANTYCEWVGGHLPTEAEWEKAARGTDGRIYPWGNNEPTCDLTNYLPVDQNCWGAEAILSNVSAYSSGASPFGAYNLAGNVWEWVADWYGAYPNTLARNPTGQESGEDKILRGGSMTSPAENIRTTFRFASSPSSLSDTIGFRCAVSASETITTEAEDSPTVTALPTAQAASTSPIDGMPMVRVPAGEFSMGSDEHKDSQPVHTVYLDEFWIDQTEVTNEMYQLCVSAGDCDAPVIAAESTRQDYFISSVYNNYPVIHVEWINAKTYCEWAGRRLPTEAEWEKAARGTDGRMYPWAGTDFSCELVNYNPAAASLGCEGIKDTQPVGNHLENASPYGALDMVGNVAEWVADWYSPTYYSESPFDNPTGPVTGEDHVMRGSSFRNIKAYLTTFYRSWYGNGNDQGFRCAMDAEP